MNNGCRAASHAARSTQNTTRIRFRAELAKHVIGSLESSANFVLVPVNDCAIASGNLERGGICARSFRNLAGIGDAIRIAIGPWNMMQRCLDALVVGDMAGLPATSGGGV